MLLPRYNAEPPTFFVIVAENLKKLHWRNDNQQDAKINHLLFFQSTNMLLSPWQARFITRGLLWIFREQQQPSYLLASNETRIEANRRRKHSFNACKLRRDLRPFCCASTRLTKQDTKLSMDSSCYNSLTDETFLGVTIWYLLANAIYVRA